MHTATLHAPNMLDANNTSHSPPTTVGTPLSEKSCLPHDLDTLHSGSTTRANSPVSLDVEKGIPSSAGSSIRADDLSSQLSFRTTLYIVIALMINQFLATSDATIVSTSLPTIVTELHGTQNEYAWVPVAYLLTQTACQPLYGKLADVFGRRPVIYASTFIFLVGSALCGAAQSMRWLIVARGLSGIGGGGIVNSVWVLTTEIVPPGSQAKWSQALSVTWSASAVAGPILGGLFTGSISWRWAFYINLPIGMAALTMLWYFLRRVHLVRKLPDGSEDKRPRNVAIKHAFRTFDYIGLLLLMGGTSALVIGFSFAGYNSWRSPRTLGLLISGVCALILAGIWEAFQPNPSNALLPSAIFRKLTIVNILIVSILHNFAFTAGTYYIPLYYQALHGTSPLVAGMQVLPFSLGAALATIPTAWFISWRPGHQWIDRTLKICIALGLALSAVGYGLMITLNERSGMVAQEIYPLIAGIGIGILFHTPFQVITNSLPKRDLAAATGAFFLVRFIGTTTGLSVAGAIFDSNWMMRKPAGYISMTNNPLSIDLRSLVHIPDPQLRDAVLSAVSASVSSVWIVCTPCLGAAFLLSLLLRVKHHPSHYSSPSAPLSATSSLTDVEKGLGSGISSVDEKLNSATSTPGELPTLHLKPSVDISPTPTLLPITAASSPSNSGEGPESLEFQTAAREVLDEQPLKLILSPPPVPRNSDEQTRSTQTDEEDPQRTHQNV
ncbi:hypothetical protein CPB86DRAFT_619859 [Serendipita vermifera]|nr:hypothetical protein CPB86DRAFT_619859 [Serendipita vermifera]